MLSGIDSSQSLSSLFFESRHGKTQPAAAREYASGDTVSISEEAKKLREELAAALAATQEELPVSETEAVAEPDPVLEAPALAATAPEAGEKQDSEEIVSLADLFQDTVGKITPMEYVLDCNELDKFFDYMRSLLDACDRGEIAAEDIHEKLAQFARGKTGSGWMLGETREFYEYQAAVMDTYRDVMSDMGLLGGDSEARPGVSPEQAKEFKVEFRRRVKADKHISGMMQDLGVEV
jgi:hypothetical protein